MINWTLALQIAIPFATLLLGVGLNRWLDRREKLFVHYGHIAGFPDYQPVDTDGNPTGAPVTINSHAVTIRNTGKKTAENVRVSHYVLPAFRVVPDIEYRVKELPDGGRDIVFPKLVPGDEVSINYLYFGALTFERVTTNVRSDNGQAKVLRMNWARQYSPTFNRFAGALMLLGALAATYLAVVGIVVLYGLVQ